MKKKMKRENKIKQKIIEIVECEKVKILKVNKVLKKDNIIIIEIIKYFIVKKCSYQPKIGLNSLKSSTMYACF